jgi:ABC-type Na+ efflux pump permease subunit
VFAALPAGAVVNALDLIAFILVTPELIGERRFDALTGWVRRVLGRERRLIGIVVGVVAAGQVARLLGVPHGVWRLSLLIGGAFLIVTLFALIRDYARRLPSRQLMLGLGAVAFVLARLIGILDAFGHA